MQNRFQPNGPASDPPGGGTGAAKPDFAATPWWRPEITRSIPLMAVVSIAAGIVGYAFRSGEASSAQTAFQNGVMDHFTRIETDHARDLAAFANSAKEQGQRLEAYVNGRFDGIDRRRDQTMRDLAARGDAADKRDEQFGQDLSRLDNRLTRIEALREFINQNGASTKR